MFDGPVHLVGHSLGGAIVARSALEQAERVASLTLIESVLFNLLEETEDPTAAEHRHLAATMAALVQAGDRERAARVFVDSSGAPGGFDDMDARTRADSRLKDPDSWEAVQRSKADVQLNVSIGACRHAIESPRAGRGLDRGRSRRGRSFPARITSTTIAFMRPVFRMAECSPICCGHSALAYSRRMHPWRVASVSQWNSLNRDRCFAWLAAAIGR